MEICNKKLKENELIKGHLYKYNTGTGEIYIFTTDGNFVRLTDGFCFKTDFPEKYIDVTSKYCLTEK